MPNSPENILNFQTLFECADLSVHDYQCKASRGGPEKEEFAEENQIVLMRRGVFCRHFGKRSIASDLNQVVFFSKGSDYCVSHPGDCGDRGTILSPSPAILRDILEELAPELAAGSEIAFPFAAGPCSTSTFWKHRQLVQKLESRFQKCQAADLANLEIAEAAIALVQEALAAAILQNESTTRSNSRKTATKLVHQEQVHAAKAYISNHLGDPIKLEDIASAASISPFHLSRTFKQLTGTSLHQYVIQLRLRESLELLGTGNRDLSSIALDLGFNSHSHFSDAFQREFNCSPSSLKKMNRSK